MIPAIMFAMTALAPVAPVNLRTLSGGPTNSIRAAWDDGVGGGAPTSWQVWHRPGTTGAYTLIGSPTVREFTFSINPAVLRHYVYIVAVNSAGNSPPSAIMEVVVA